MPRGVEYKIPLRDLLQAAEQHRVGWSLRAISRMNWKRWGYASPKSALEGLRMALRSIDAPVRDRIEATKAASTLHGLATREARKGGEGHDAFLAHRRELRTRDTTRCEGVRDSYPNRGARCSRRVAGGARYCYQHREQRAA